MLNVILILYLVILNYLKSYQQFASRKQIIFFYISKTNLKTTSCYINLMKAKNLEN
ncbi:hypothetical protein CHRYSEOSP005_07290 [Chryseobacterium sp. Alg-005]